MMKQISERALVARVNRVLTKEGQQIFTCRQNSRWYSEIGTYYIKDLKKNTFAAHGIVDLNKVAAELGIGARME